MTNGSRRVGITGLLAACVLAGATACTGGSHSATAAPTGPQFSGRLIVETRDGELDQITFGADGTAADQQIVAAPSPRVEGSQLVVPVAVTPDGTTLAYGSAKGLVLRNLKTGADTTLTPPDSLKISCVSWAPDGQHLTVGTAGALYLSDQAGHMTSLYTVKSQAYVAGQVGSKGAPGFVDSSFTCGNWLNPTDLVFQQSGPEQRHARLHRQRAALPRQPRLRRDDAPRQRAVEQRQAARELVRLEPTDPRLSRSAILPRPTT